MTKIKLDNNPDTMFTKLLVKSGSRVEIDSILIKFANAGNVLTINTGAFLKNKKLSVRSGGITKVTSTLKSEIITTNNPIIVMNRGTFLSAK